MDKVSSSSPMLILFGKVVREKKREKRDKLQWAIFLFLRVFYRKFKRQKRVSRLEDHNRPALFPLNYITLITLLLSSETQERERVSTPLVSLLARALRKEKRKREEKRKRRRREARGQGAALLPTLSSWQEHSNSALSGRQTPSSIIGPIQLAPVLEVTPSPPIETHR